MTPLQVDRFTHDHRALERLGGELRLAVVRHDPPMARGRLTELSQQLADHVRREAAAVAEDGARCDVAGRARIHAAQRAAAEFAESFGSFAATWGSAAAISRDLDGFRLEMEHWLVKLGRLLLDEEARLYPYLNSVGTIPPEVSEANDTVTQRISRADLRRALIG